MTPVAPLVLKRSVAQHQAWILNELIRYLDDEKSGASGFEGMGREWVRVRESARNDTLRASDPEARTIASRWEQFVEYLCLRLSQDLGVDVKHRRPRGKRPEERIAMVTEMLASDGALECSIRVPDAVGPLGVRADLRTRRVSTTVEVPAPKEGRPKTRINWLLRQLVSAPDDLRVEVSFANVRTTRSELLRDRRDSPEKLLMEGDSRREPRSFVLAQAKPMGKKRGKGEGSFVADTRKQTTDFYRELVQGLMPPRTKAPKIREDEKKPSGADAPAQDAAKERSEGSVRREHETSLQHLAEVMPFAPS